MAASLLVASPELLQAFTRALAAELPEISAERLAGAVQRAAAAAARTHDPDRVLARIVRGEPADELLDEIAHAEAVFAEAAEWEKVVDLQIARLSCASEPAARAEILLQLAEIFERELIDADRALAARLGAFDEMPSAAALEPLRRLPRSGDQWCELDRRIGAVAEAEADGDLAASLWVFLAEVRRDHLDRAAQAIAALESARAVAPTREDVLRRLADGYTGAGRLEDALEVLAALADLRTDDAARAAVYREMAAGWYQLGALDRAAECHEWVLTFEPADARASAALAEIYRARGQWRSLIDTLCRRVETLAGAARADVCVEIARVYQEQLSEPGSAIDFYRSADELDPDRPGVLLALAHLWEARGAFDDAMVALERVAAACTDPEQRALTLHHAAELAWYRLDDADTAADLLHRAIAADPEMIAAIDALARLQRERGELAGTIELLVRAAQCEALWFERPRLLCDAAEAALALGERARALALYRDARAAGAVEPRCAAALADLLWEVGAYGELVTVLEELCEVTEDAAARRQRLLALGEAAAEAGEPDRARRALIAAVELDPADAEARRSLGELLFSQGEWADARDMLEQVLDRHEDALPRAACVELHFQVGHCARQLGDLAAALTHATTALALDPDHRPSLMLRAELDADDPAALVADQLAMANAAPPEEKAALFAAIGDIYADRLGDPASARAMYREALTHRPTDHLLLSRCLGVVAAQGEWSDSLDLLARLVETETEPAVRARYRQVSALIRRDELDQPDAAEALLWQAIDDDPSLFLAADELEAMLQHGPRRERLVRFYYHRLEQLRQAEGRPGELVRLWDRLAALCVELDRQEDAICAFEVGARLCPDDPARRQRLAELYVQAGEHHYDKAIGEHQALLRGNKRRVASYEALEELYALTGRHEEAEACRAALRVVAMRSVAERERVETVRPLPLGAETPSLGAEDWQRIDLGEVDRTLSHLFSLVAPLVAAERARQRPPRRLSGKTLRERDPRPFARVLRHATEVIGLEQVAIRLDRQQNAPCRIALRSTGTEVVPALSIGQPALEGIADERTLAFGFARRLVDLRADRFARLLCPRADELAQIIEAAVGLAGCDEPAHAESLGAGARWLATALQPVDLEKVVTLGERLRERGVEPTRGALDWLEATERAADRVGYLLAGDLATCVRVLEREPSASADKQARILDLVWSSVTEDLFRVRSRLERWSDAARLAEPNPHVA